MIINKKIKINITSRNIKYYKKIYDNISINETVDINVNDLHPGSNVNIEVCCDICGDIKNMTFVRYKKYISNDNKYYCNKCKWIKIKKTKENKYNDENYNNRIKFKSTCIDIYGVDNPMKNEKILDKNKETCLNLYNYDNVFKNENIKFKIRETNFKKYGYNYPIQNHIIKDKCKNTLLKNYNVDVTFKSNVIKEKIKDKLIYKYNVKNILEDKNIRDKIVEKKLNKWFNDLKNIYNNIDFINVDFKLKSFEIKCEKEHIFHISFNLFYNRNRKNHKTVLCTICNPINKKESGQEIMLKNFIEENYKGLIEIHNKNIISPYELDIYLPELKLSFEFNGLYWHSIKFKEKNYHKNKTIMAEKNGIKLIQIYEDDWNFKKDIIKSRILNLLGKSNRIYARKCLVKEVKDNKLVRNFLLSNHSQGFVGSAIKIGLFYDDELVSLMTFGSFRKAMGRIGSAGSYELLRFCNKLNTEVIGGASKLFQYFLNSYEPKEVLSFADRSWSNGDLYIKLGFDLIDDTNPNYYYIIDGKRKHRFGFRKDVLIKKGGDPNKTEHQIMEDLGIDRIYDSGNLKFLFKNKNEKII